MSQQLRRFVDASRPPCPILENNSLIPIRLLIDKAGSLLNLSRRPDSILFMISSYEMVIGPHDWCRWALNRLTQKECEEVAKTSEVHILE